MEPVTDEELLRLARVAFAKLWAEREALVRDDKVDPVDIAQWDHLSICGGMNNHHGQVEEIDHGEVCLEHFSVEAPTREAARAALLVLAGEPHPETVAARADAERHRERAHELANQVTYLSGFIEASLGRLVREGHSDLAAELRRVLETLAKREPEKAEVPA